MRRSTILLAPLVVCTVLALNASHVLAAGSGGGGGSLSSSSAPARNLSPEELSDKAMRAGIRQRDKALKQEKKAGSAKSEKARNKALARAEKAYKKAIDKQGEALRHNPNNYKAANELGFALRKTGDYRKAIGAYNYSLKINPNFTQAIEYRGEAFLALGFYDQAKNAYLTLFRNDRELADLLMTKLETWAATKTDKSEAEAQFAGWIEERSRLAKATADLSMNNVRDW